MTGAIYTCAFCRGTFENDGTEDEVRAESLELWGDIAPEHLIVVCDECFTREVFR